MSDKNWREIRYQFKTIAKLISTCLKEGLQKSYFLLTTGTGNLNKRDYYGKTPLYWAAYKGHRDCIAELLDCGADVNIPCRHGGTPLHAVVSLYPDCVIILVKVSDPPLRYHGRRRHSADERRCISEHAPTLTHKHLPPPTLVESPPGVQGLVRGSNENFPIVRIGTQHVTVKRSCLRCVAVGRGREPAGPLGRDAHVPSGDERAAGRRAEPHPRRRRAVLQKQGASRHLSSSCKSCERDLSNLSVCLYTPPKGRGATCSVNLAPHTQRPV